MTILRAATGFQADDAFHLDLGAAVRHPDFVRQGQQFLEPLVGQLQHFENLLLAQSLAALEHLLARHRQNIGGVGVGCWPSRRLSHQLLLQVLPAYRSRR